MGADTFRFMKKKLKTIYPYFIFALVTSFIVWSIPANGSFFTLAKLKSASAALLNLIFPYSLGFQGHFYLGYSWYLSAMIYSMVILFPLLRRNRETFYYILAPSFTAFGLGFYSHCYTTVGIVSQSDYLLSAGLLRGISEISLGCLCYVVSKKLRSFDLTKTGSCLLSVAEAICLTAVGVKMVLIRQSGAIDFVFLFFIAAAVTIGFSGKSATQFAIGGKAAAFWGNFSFALFINSNCWSYLTARLWPEMSYWNAMALYVAMAVGAALSCMAVCKGLKVFWDAFGGKAIRALLILPPNERSKP